MNLTVRLLIIFFTICPFYTMGQPNRVLNGNFENYIICPSNGVGIGFWMFNSWYDIEGSVDYFNSCTNGTFNVPNNFRGTQPAANGDGYIGFVSFINNNPVGELPASRIAPLMPGTIYEVSMSISMADSSSIAHDKFGIAFMVTGSATVPRNRLSALTPGVIFPGGPITDTVNWIRLSSLFFADSAYDHVVVGNIPITTSRNYVTVGSGGYSYYYVDSVVVKVHDSLVLHNADTVICAGDTLNMDYYSYRKKSSNNVFKVQLSDAAGSFSSPVDIGSVNSDTSGTIQCVIPSNTPTGDGYKLRIIASFYPDTSDAYYTYKIGNSVSKPIAANNGPVCSNTILQLTSSSATQNALYKWTGPSGYSAKTQNPTITSPIPANSGDYIVTAYLYGCEASDTTTAVVQAGFGPTGVIATANGPVCADDTVWVTGASSGTNDSYSWIGPNGFTSSSKDFVLTGTVATQSGDYILTANDGLCVGKDTVKVTIKPRPANFGATYNGPLCGGSTLVLSASTSSTGVTYSWTGPNSFSSSNSSIGISGANPVHNGNYYVTATLSGCSLNDTVAVTVKPKPAAPTMNNNGPLCAGETIMLAAASTTSNVSYSWTGPNSYTSSLQNPTIGNSATNMSGIYTATVILDGCSSSANTSVTVKPMPTAVSTSSNTPVCAGDNLLVSIGTSTSGSIYSWTGPNSFTSANLSNTITSSTIAATGWYVATVDLNGCGFKDSVYATVNPIPPTPTISFNSPLCVGETLNVNGGSITGATFNWTGPNGFSSTQNNPSRSNMQWADTGVYKTIVTVNGCPSPEAQARVTMNAVPFVTILSTPTDTICSGQTVTFNALANGHGGTPLYQWHVNGNPVSTGTIFNTNSLNNQDVVRCDMTEYTKCSVPYKDESNDITMTVIPWLAPSVSITANPTTPLKPDEFITFTAKPIDGGTIPKFQWKRNGQNIVGATGAIWSANTLNDNDDICVELTSTYRCPQPLTANSNCIKVRVLTGVDDINGSNKWTVHPNPNNGRFTITATDIYSTEARLEVVNTLGQVVYRDIATTQQGSISKEVNLNDVAKGIYLLRIYAEDEINIVKLQVE